MGREAAGHAAALALPEDRLPPQNLHCERGVIGSALMDPGTLHDVALILGPGDFYRGDHATIYRAMMRLYDDGRPVDLSTVVEELRRSGELDRVGGYPALAEIMAAVPHVANAAYHAEIVRGKAVARGLIEAANAVIVEAYAQRRTAAELVAFAESRVFAVADAEAAGGTVDLAEIARALAPGARALGTGFPSLDDLLGGLGDGAMIVVAARPSMGKTAFALSVCLHVAMVQDVPVLLVSLEMGRGSIARRLASAISGVPASRIACGGPMPGEARRLEDAAQAIRWIYIDDSSGRTPSQIAANARRMVARHGVGLIVVDYLQLIDGGDGRAANRQEQVAGISRAMKGLAREVGRPVVVLAQLNRAVEAREEKRPRLSDLRESGAIEQDADAVLMLYRPEYYDPTDSPGVAEVHVVKNRDGDTGPVRLTFRKELARFESGEPLPAGL